MVNRSLKPLSLPEVEQAAKRLGVELEGISTESLTAAFRARIREVHPDSASAAPVENVPEEITALRQAKAMLLLWISSRPKPGCSVCHGRGYVQAGPFGTRPCTSC